MTTITFLICKVGNNYNSHQIIRSLLVQQNFPSLGTYQQRRYIQTYMKFPILKVLTYKYSHNCSALCLAILTILSNSTEFRLDNIIQIMEQDFAFCSVFNYKMWGISNRPDFTWHRIQFVLLKSKRRKKKKTTPRSFQYSRQDILVIRAPAREVLPLERFHSEVTTAPGQHRSQPGGGARWAARDPPDR